MRSATLPFVLGSLIASASPIVLQAQTVDSQGVAKDPAPQADNVQRGEPFKFTMREWGFYESLNGWGMIPAAVLRFPDDRPGLEALNQLRAHKRLCIEVHGADATDPVLERIAALDNLRILQLQNTVVPENGWKHLAGHGGLRLLMAANVEVKPDALAHLGAIPNLEWLMLNSIHVDDEALRHLANARTLTLLSLRNAVITDDGIAHLRGLTELRSLILPDSRLTDAGLAHLKHLDKLLELEVGAEEAFTVAGVVHLKDLHDLRYLGGIPESLITAHLPHAARHRTEHRLRNEPFAVDAIELPLADVCKDLSGLLAMEFAADDDVGHVKITIEANGITAHSAIALLSELHGLTWTFEPDGVTFSSRAAVQRNLEQRTYDLQELLGAEPRHAEEVAAAIPMLIAPKSWSSAPSQPTSSITVSGARLTVVHHSDIQRQVSLLLDEFGPRGLRRFPSPAEGECVEFLAADATLKTSEVPLDRLLSDHFPDRRLLAVLDRAAFAEHGIATDQSVIVRVEDMPLQDVLDLIAEPLGLAWTVRHEAVIVFPKAEEAAMLEARVYHIGDALTLGETADDLAERVRDSLGFAHLQGRFAAGAFNRLVARASFREHLAIQKLIDELARE